MRGITFLRISNVEAYRSDEYHFLRMDYMAPRTAHPEE